MTAEKAQAEFDKLIAENSFTIAGHTGDRGIPIYHRVWKDGSKTLEVRIMQSGEYTLMTVKKNGKIAGDIVRDYSNPQKAFDAMLKITNTIYCAPQSLCDHKILCLSIDKRTTICYYYSVKRHSRLKDAFKDTKNNESNSHRSKNNATTLQLYKISKSIDTTLQRATYRCSFFVFQSTDRII